MSDAFVTATVVRAQRPTCVHAGDVAVVRSDGSLLRILPEVFDTIEEDGAVTVGNPCLSGGGIELFLEPTAKVLTAAAPAAEHHCCHHA